MEGMGKGCGCVPSKKREATADLDRDPPDPERNRSVSDQSSSAAAGTANPVVDGQVRGGSGKLKIFIVFYSMYGHVELLARRMKKGVDSMDGVEGFLYRVPETLSTEVLDQMKVPQKDDDSVPLISAGELVEADGLLFGFPTRYGCMAAQMKAFFDSTGQLWREQRLAGVPAGFFVSTGTQNGGQETTA